MSLAFLRSGPQIIVVGPPRPAEPRGKTKDGRDDAIMALDAETKAFLAQLAAGGGRRVYEMTPDEARAFGETLRALYGAGPDMARTEHVAVRTATGTLPARVLVPHGDVRGVLVWYHGGGWVLGSIEETDTLGRKLAERTGCAVVLVGYRLAPEHRFPTAVEDAYAALQWAHANLERLAGRSAKLIIGGDSAGGNLTAVVAIRARDLNGPPIAVQVLVYPATDTDFDRPSYLAEENQLALSRANVLWFWNHYAPDAGDRRTSVAAPLRTKDLSRLPVTVILTAEHDVLRDEGEAYAQALVGAGVPVTFRRFRGQMHLFFTLVNVLPGAARGLEFVGQAIDSAFEPADYG